MKRGVSFYPISKPEKKKGIVGDINMFKKGEKTWQKK